MCLSAEQMGMLGLSPQMGDRIPIRRFAPLDASALGGDHVHVYSGVAVPDVDLPTIVLYY